MNGFADTFGVLGGAQPQFDDRFGAPQQDPRTDDLIRALAMRKVLGDMSQGNGGQWGAPMAPVAMPTGAPRPMTDFGGASKMQPNVPMPRPDPRDAIAAAPDFIAGNQIPDLAPMGAPRESMQDMLPTGGQRGMNTALSGIGAGMSQIQGNTAGANFARGFGASVAGGNKRSDSDFDQQIKILDRLKQAAESGDNREYRRAQTEWYLLSNEQIRRDMVNPPAAKSSRVGSSQIERIADTIVAEDKAAGIDTPRSVATDRAAKMVKQTEQRDANARARLGLQASSLDQRGLSRDPEGTMDKYGQKFGAKPSAEAVVKQPEQPIEAAKPRAGGQNNPHRPMSRQEAEQIPSGEWFISPKTGQPMVMP